MNNEIKTTEFGAVQKNTDGHLGPKCNWCGGYGYLNTITGGSAGCQRCNQSGIEQPTVADLMKKISEMETKK